MTKSAPVSYLQWSWSCGPIGLVHDHEAERKQLKVIEKIVKMSNVHSSVWVSFDSTTNTIKMSRINTLTPKEQHKLNREFSHCMYDSMSNLHLFIYNIHGGHIELLNNLEAEAKKKEDTKLGHEHVLMFISQVKIRNSSFQVYQMHASWRMAVVLKIGRWKCVVTVLLSMSNSPTTD